MARWLWIFAAAFVFCTTMAHAQSGVDATLSWLPPDSYENGDALDPAVDLTGYGVFMNGVQVATAPNSASSFLVLDLPFGDNAFYITSIATNGLESVMSNVAVRTVVDDRVPNPPTLIDVILAWIKRIFGWFA